MKSKAPEINISSVKQIIAFIVFLFLLASCATNTIITPTVTPTFLPERGFLSIPHGPIVVARAEVKVETLDPAFVYDSASGEIVQNIYETLVFYDGNKPDAFVPMLADSWTVSEDGFKWVFHIRDDVHFKIGNLDPSDVAYSLQRSILYSQPELANLFFKSDENQNILFDDPEIACNKIHSAIVPDERARTVTIHLAQPKPALLPSLAQPFAAILDKQWAIENGAWDGSCETWQQFSGILSSEEDPLSKIANGTGPFDLEKFDNGERIDLVWKEKYWQEHPRSEGVIFIAIPEWETRYYMMLAGDAEFVDIPAENLLEMSELIGEECIFDPKMNAYPCEVIDKIQPFRVYIGESGQKYYTQPWINGVILNPAFEGYYFYPMYKG